MGIGLARKRFESLAKLAVKHEELQVRFVKHVAKAIRLEIKSLSSTSIISDARRDHLCNLSWNKLKNELKTKIPVLFNLLTSCIPATNDGLPMVLMCISIIIKANKRMATFLQKLISLGLYSGHASKSVSI